MTTASSAVNQFKVSVAMLRRSEFFAAISDRRYRLLTVPHLAVLTIHGRRVSIGRNWFGILVYSVVTLVRPRKGTAAMETTRFAEKL
jgi:hypothetical protein